LPGRREGNHLSLSKIVGTTILLSFRTDRAMRGLIRNLAGLKKIPGSPLRGAPE
jgi:hypothetical protein